MNAARAAPALLVLVGLAACDPVYRVQGTVVDASGTALAGVTVTKACPSGGTEVATTTAAGDFSFGGVGGSFEAPKCSLRIEKAGFATQTLRTTDVCYRSSQAGNYGNTCKPGEGKITLVP
jgi:hypothetical protein